MEKYLGEPDGANEHTENYLEVNKKLHLDFDKLDVKVIVGRKGSGKSLCMRLFQEHTEGDATRYAFSFKNNPPNLHNIIRFSKDIPHHIRSNSWEAIWSYAILLSCATAICFRDEHEKKYFAKITDQECSDLLASYGGCFLELDGPTHPYDIIDVITNEFTYDEFMKLINSAVATNFKNRLLRMVGRSSNICFFLDALDEEIQSAPAILVDVTRGLFFAVMHAARDKSLSSKIHTTITIRDIVYSSIMFSEHKDRYKNTKHIKALSWNHGLISKFTTEKIKWTFDKHKRDFVNAGISSATGLSDILGFGEIENENKGFFEDVMRYLIRHTNYSPRDFIHVGNEICDKILDEGGIDEERYKSIVNKHSEELADQLVRISSAHMLSFYYDDKIDILLDMQADIEEYRKSAPFRDKFTEDWYERMRQGITDGFVEPIKQFVQFIGDDVFTYEKLREGLGEFIREADTLHTKRQNYELHKLENVMWLQGLIGVRRNGDEITDTFYSYTDAGEFTVLPDNQEQYVFFPGLITLCGLKVSEGVPVGYNVDQANGK